MRVLLSVSMFVCLLLPSAQAAANIPQRKAVAAQIVPATIPDTAIVGVDVFDAASGGSAIRVRGTSKFLASEVRVLPIAWDEFPNLRYPGDATYPIFTVFVPRPLVEDTGVFHFEDGAVALLSTDVRDVKGIPYTMIQVVLDNAKSWAWNIVMMDNSLVIAFAPTSNVVWPNRR